MTGVTYTGNYQTVDDYNPYKYTSQAPFGADYTESGNVAADVMVGYEWTIFDMDDDEVDNDELISLIDSAVQDHRAGRREPEAQLG